MYYCIVCFFLKIVMVLFLIYYKKFCFKIFDIVWFYENWDDVIIYMYVF